MIVNRLESGWEIIYQPAHALLSAQLVGRWRVEAHPPRWWETLVAVSQHDNGWREWEAAPQVNPDGTPRNFTEMTVPEAMAQWRRGVTRARHQSAWVGLLVSHHATTLFDSRRGELEALNQFLDEQHAQQERWRASLGASPEEVDHAYAMVRWTDWLSLVLCWRRLPADGSPISLGTGPDGTRYEAALRMDESVALTPWPFDEARFTVTVETRLLSQPTFADDEALQVALLDAPVQPRAWTLMQ